MELETNSKKTMKTILIIDDHTMFRQALRSMCDGADAAGTITVMMLAVLLQPGTKRAHQDFDLMFSISACFTPMVWSYCLS